MSRRTVRIVIAASAALLLLGACSSDGDSGSPAATNPSADTSPNLDDSVHRIGPADFQRFMTDEPDAPVVNVHIPYEQHIEGTDAFVSFEEIADWSDLPEDLDAPIALYCRSGNMSGQASDTLAALGYTNITDLEGGMNAWSAAGLPLLDEDPAQG